MMMTHHIISPPIEEVKLGQLPNCLDTDWRRLVAAFLGLVFHFDPFYLVFPIVYDISTLVVVYRKYGLLTQAFVTEVLTGQACSLKLLFQVLLMVEIVKIHQPTFSRHLLCVKSSSTLRSPG